MRRIEFLILGVIGTYLMTFDTVAKGQSSQDPQWVGTWAASVMALPNKRGVFATDTTLRQIVHVSAGGSAVRIVLTNEFGTADLKIAAATVALPVPLTANDSVTPENLQANPLGGLTDGILPPSVMPVAFGDHVDVNIAPGAVAVSDPIPMNLKPQSDLVVTLYIPGQLVEVISGHQFSNQVNFIADGNQVSAATLKSGDTSYSWRFLKSIAVAGNNHGAIVCLGDSITDGVLSKTNKNHRYPDVLESRLQEQPKTRGWAVLNEGIGGNSVLHDLNFTGPNALARLDRDVISQIGVRYIILLEGINDIGRIAAPKVPADAITADDLIAGYRQIIARSHLKGIKVIGATLTPYKGAHTDSDVGQAVRAKVNEFIRNGHEFDGVIDFGKATGDPSDPDRYAKLYDGGDHLHPSDAGYKAMGESIDLDLFR